MNNKPLSNFEIIKLFIDEVNQKDAMGFHSFLNHLKEKDLSVVKYNEKSINMNDEDTTTLKNQLLKMYMHIYGKDRPNIIAKLEKDLSLAFTNSKNIEHFSEQLNYLLKEKYASYSYSEKEKIKEYFKYILDKVKKVSEFLDKKGEILLNTLFLSKDTENVENSYTEFLKNIITSVKYPQFKILIDKLPKEIAKQHCENYIKLMYKKLKIDNKEVSDKDIINEIENFYYDFNFQKRTLLLLTDILNNYWSDVKNKEVKDYIESVSSYLSSKLHINDKDAMSHLLKIVIENNKQLRILVTKHDIYCKNIKNINNIEKKLDYYIKNIKPNKIPSEYIERLKKDKKKLQKDDDSLKTEIESLKNQFKNQINSYLQTFLIEDEQIEELKEKLGILPKVKEGESSLIANYWNRLWNYSIDSVSGLYNTTKDLVSSAITTTATIGSGYVVGSMAGVALGPLAPMGGIIGAAIALRGKDLAEEVMNRFNSFWEEKKGKFEKYEEDEMFKASLGFKHIFNNESKSEIIRKYFINYLFHIELKLIEAEECNLEDEINNYKKLYAKTLDDWKKINGLYGNLNIEERKKIIKEYFKEEFKNVEQNNIKKAYDKFFDILEIVTTLSPEKLEYSSYEFMLENKSSELELTEIQDNAVNHVEEKGYPLAIYETENEITVFKELQSHANSFYESINYLLDTIEGIDTENSKLPEEVDNLKIQKPSLTTKDKYGHSFLYNKIHNNDNPLFYLNLFLDEEVFIDKNKFR